MDLKNRRVVRFRTHIDPMLGPKPANAFDIRSIPFEAELTPVGVYVKLKVRGPDNSWVEEEHVVPYANLQSIKLGPIVEEAAKPAPVKAAK